MNFIRIKSVSCQVGMWEAFNKWGSDGFRETFENKKRETLPAAKVHYTKNLGKSEGCLPPVPPIPTSMHGRHDKSKITSVMLPTT